MRNAFKNIVHSYSLSLLEKNQLGLSYNRVYQFFNIKDGIANFSRTVS